MCLVNSQPRHTTNWLPPAVGGQDPHRPWCSWWVREAAGDGAGPGIPGAGCRRGCQRWPWTEARGTCAVCTSRHGQPDEGATVQWLQPHAFLFLQSWKLAGRDACLCPHRLLLQEQEAIGGPATLDWINDLLLPYYLSKELSHSKVLGSGFKT